LSDPVTERGAVPHRRFLNLDPAAVQRWGDPFRPLEPACEFLQFDRPLTPGQLERAAALLTDRPDVQLYVYGRAGEDLEFLRYFRGLRRLHLALYDLKDIAGFSHLGGNLEELTFGSTKRQFSLAFAGQLPRLAKLFLVGHKNDIGRVAVLTGLTSLGLSGITLPDLSLLLPFTGLRELSIFLGGTTNLAMLSAFPQLESLFLMRISKLSDLGVLAQMQGLTSLRLDWMRNVTCLPSFAQLQRLDNVVLDTMKGLADLAPVAAAPQLRRLTVTAMPQLTPESFRCFLGHPSLSELYAYTGKTTVNASVKRMFPEIAR
jgi:hypothetical protein